MATRRFPHLSPFFCALILTTIALHTIAEPTCTVDRYLNECGYYGIQQAECESRDCCWNPNVPAGQPWCFRKNGGYEYFSDVLPRVDCGYFGIFRSDCEGRGCMYAPAFGQAWCYFPNTNTDPDTCPYRRVECGYYGIGQDECEGRGCCWYPLGEGSAEPWCFHSIHSQPAAVVEPSSEEQTEEASPEEPTTEETVPEEETTEETPAPEESTTEEMPVVELPPELAGMMLPSEEGEGLGIRALPEEVPTTETIAQTAQPVAEASAEAPAQAESVTVRNEHLQDETSQAMELNFDVDTFEKPTPTSAYLNHQKGFRVACDTEALTEHDCLAIAECYWVAEVTPGFGACMRRDSDPGRRSMGKFFKPRTIY